ncbi:hydroxymethylglutaryl-CoA synthase family protein [Candidatus Scalindua japonica]
MTEVGIEALNVYGGEAFLDVATLAKERNLDMVRFENLLMLQKTVALYYEDSVSFGINAAKPIIDELSEEERSRIELVIVSTESAVDFGKSLSTYVHHYLKLSRHCRLFEIKQACYAGTAAFQMAVGFVLSQTSPGAKALVVSTDISRMFPEMRGLYHEPSGGAGAIAYLVSDQPKVFSLDIGATGYYGYEVMDTCRPTPDHEFGDADLSLLSYLDCCENAFLMYQDRVEGVDYQDTFDYLAFHTPFGGMVKGTHRTMMRKFKKATPSEIEQDFQVRVQPSLSYCQRVGNVMSGTVFLALAGLIDNGDFPTPKRVGVFSYGSGCCSEFYSGVVTSSAKQIQAHRQIGKTLSERYELSMEEYEAMFDYNKVVRFGIKDVVIQKGLLPGVDDHFLGRGRLVLSEIKNFHRKYEWM